ncbi:MAG: PIN domain-containing protein [Caulobacteraceae bacterium]
MTDVLVDSSVVIDIATASVEWFEWSADALRRLGAEGQLLINQIVVAESVSAYRRPNDDRLDFDALFVRRELPWAAAALAGEAHAAYRRRGGARTAILADFLIGAHAQAESLILLTRDPTRVRAAFPSVSIVAP